QLDAKNAPQVASARKNPRWTAGCDGRSDVRFLSLPALRPDLGPDEGDRADQERVAGPLHSPDVEEIPDFACTRRVDVRERSLRAGQRESGIVDGIFH